VEATLPLRWLCQLPLCGLAAHERLQAIIPGQQVLNTNPVGCLRILQTAFFIARKEMMKFAESSF
jgi:hypothetical protein